MVKCPNCSQTLQQKAGVKKFCAQIGNPDLAIVETTDPQFCGGCNEYYLTTEQVIAAVSQIADGLGEQKKPIEKGIYS